MAPRALRRGRDAERLEQSHLRTTPLRLPVLLLHATQNAEPVNFKGIFTKKVLKTVEREKQAEAHCDNPPNRKSLSQPQEQSANNCRILDMHVDICRDLA